MKRSIAVVLVPVLFLICLFQPLVVNAAPVRMSDNALFDADFYKNTYGHLFPDPVFDDPNASDEALYKHYIDTGRKSRCLPYETAAYTLGTYTHAASFVDNVNREDVVAYASSNRWEAFKADVLVLVGFITGNGGQAAADSLLNDPVKAKKLLADIISEIEESHKVDQLMANQLNNSIDALGEDLESKGISINTGDASDILKYSSTLVSLNRYAAIRVYYDAKDSAALDLDEDLNKAFEIFLNNHPEVKSLLDKSKTTTRWLKLFSDSIKAYDDITSQAVDYHYSLQLLDSLMNAIPQNNTVLLSAVSDLKQQYENEYENAFAEIFSSFWSVGTDLLKLSGVDFGTSGDIASSVIDVFSSTDNKFEESFKNGIDLVLGKGFKLGRSLVDILLYATGEQERVDSLDKVLMSTNLRVETLDALRKAEEAYFLDPSGENYDQFRAVFDVARLLTLTQYKNMLSYYKSISGFQSEIDELEKCINLLENYNIRSHIIDVLTNSDISYINPAYAATVSASDNGIAGDASGADSLDPTNNAVDLPVDIDAAASLVDSDINEIEAASSLVDEGIVAFDYIALLGYPAHTTHTMLPNGNGYYTSAGGFKSDYGIITRVDINSLLEGEGMAGITVNNSILSAEQILLSQGYTFMGRDDNEGSTYYIYMKDGYIVGLEVFLYRNGYNPEGHFEGGFVALSDSSIRYAIDCLDDPNTAYYSTK